MSILTDSGEHAGELLDGHGEAGEDLYVTGDAEVLPGHLGEELAEVGRDRQVAPFEELLGREPGPPTVDAAAEHGAAQHQHGGAMAVVGAAVAVLAHGPAEFGHGEHEHILHAFTEVAGE